ncbi:hypothetical protein LZ554_003944 [Drepanopeziza brunnea f. sp. 'monogermtubi']|nr:hypothetical protein LZ554_003944 [Drepanopeziza brunnea f. sp. 'monogermtubi']
MDEATKQFCVDRVATICKELALWQGGGVHGVDERHLCDHYLAPPGSSIDCSPQSILKHCEDLGLECSSFYFYHCDLGPGNVLIDTATNSIGIIDWETAGFVPKEWIRTKFRISGGMDFGVKDLSSRTDWRSRVQRQLEKEGFPDIAEQWMAWRAKSR